MSTRTILSRLMLPLTLLATAALTFSACDTFGSDNSDFMRGQLTRAEAMWDTAGSANYTILVTRRCDCGIEPRQVALVVENNEIAGATYTDDDTPVEPDALGRYATIPDLFDLVRDAVNRKVPVVLVQYNQDYGYVDDLIINYDRTRFDDDVLYVIDEYTPAGEGT